MFVNCHGMALIGGPYRRPERNHDMLKTPDGDAAVARRSARLPFWLLSLCQHIQRILDGRQVGLDPLEDWRHGPGMGLGGEKKALCAADAGACGLGRCDKDGGRANDGA